MNLVLHFLSQIGGILCYYFFKEAVYLCLLFKESHTAYIGEFDGVPKSLGFFHFSSSFSSHSSELIISNELSSSSLILSSA